MQLNPEQQAAVEFGDGVLQILAAAGSGKTRVLTERVVYLINERKVDPSTILALAFNKKAAEELKERVTLALGEAVGKAVWCRTFHSLGYVITSDAARQGHVPGYERGIKGVVGGRMNWFWDKAVEDAGVDPEDAGATKGSAIGRLILLKRTDTTIDEWAQDIDDPFDVILARVMRGYEAQKRRDGLIDFDDMLFWARRTLRRQSFMREKWSSYFKYVLVDEFQDVDEAQFDIVQMLAAPENNLTVVGDDFQSIYAFRGANPGFTIHFQDWYSDAHQVFLVRNYRSTIPIIECSNRLIAVNENQVKKELISEKPSEDVPTFISYASQVVEGEAVAEDIAKRIESLPATPGHFAVLYRTNAQAAFAEIALMRAAVPYHVVGGLGFYNRKEVKDIMGYLSLAVFGDDASFERVYNKPSRFLGKAWLAEVKKLAAGRGTLLNVAENVRGYGKLFKPYQIRNTEMFVGVIQRIRRAVKASDTMSDALVEIVRLIDYEAYLKKDIEEDEPDNDVLANVVALYEVAAEFTDAEQFLKFITGMQTAGDAKDDKPDTVTLSSLHRSKGLEWPHVYIIGVSAGLLPHKMSEDIEEERRLAYVGITRGKDSVRLSAFDSPSPFVTEAGVEISEGFAEEEV